MLFALFLLLLTAACKEPFTPDPLPEPAPIGWQENLDITSRDKIQYNCTATNGYVYFLGAHSMTRLTPTDSVNHIGKYHLFNPVDYGEQMPMGNDFFIRRAGHGGLGIIPLPTGFAAMDEHLLFMHQHDPDFKDFAFRIYFMSQAIVINSRNEFLVPYTTESHLKVMLVKTDYNENTELHEVAEVKTFILGDADPLIGKDIGVFCIDDIFYCAISNNLATRTFKQIGDDFEMVSDWRFDKIISIGDSLYAFSGGWMFTSTDGDTWEEHNSIGSSFDLMTYKQFKGIQLGFWGDQIFKFDPSPEGGISVSELENTGLESNSITSITEMDSTVYISTLSGAFSKPLEYFWDLKE